jgi:hypothetical protein
MGGVQSTGCRAEPRNRFSEHLPDVRRQCTGWAIELQAARGWDEACRLAEEGVWMEVHRYA